MRLVSLCPSLTELLFHLGRGADLVGITEWCVHPADGVAGIETVGGTKTPRIDRIVALRPDLVLLNREENRAEDARRLETAGIRCHQSMPRSPAETAATVRSIGRAVGRAAQAEKLALEIERRHEAVRRRSAALLPVRFAYLIWRRPWMTVNRDTYVHSLLAAAGGVNVFASHSVRYPEIGLPELAAAEPDLVLLSSEPYPFRPRDADDLARQCGLPRDRFRLVDGELLSWHGARTPEGIDYAAESIGRAR